MTDKGVQQPREVRDQLAALFEESLAHDAGGLQSVITSCSPYRRTMQTWKEIKGQLNQELIIGMREDPRLAEQQFGNF